MTFHSDRKNCFFHLFALFLVTNSTFAEGEMPPPPAASFVSTVITVAIVLFGVLALFVTFLTGRFLLKVFKEYTQARKEAKAHTPVAPKVEGKLSGSIVLGVSVLFGGLAILFFMIGQFSLASGLNLSFTTVLTSFLIHFGVIGAILFFLYVAFLLASSLWRTLVPAGHPAAHPSGLADLPPSAGLTRRSFLSLLGWAWVTFTAASMGALSTCLRFFFPNVTFEPPTKFKVGFPSAFNMGVDERFKDSNRVWIVRYPDYFIALSTICTHLGCTPNWLQAEQKFKCPCHGSGYHMDGTNFEGPAPRPLEHFQITLADDGQIQIDQSIKFQKELGQWGLPGSYLEYKA